MFEPLFNQISAGLPVVIDFITKIKDFFGGLSEPAKIAVTAFLGILAAAGPLLVVVGSIISFIAPLVTGFISIAGTIAGAGGTVALLRTAFAVVSSFITATLISRFNDNRAGSLGCCRSFRGGCGGGGCFIRDLGDELRRFERYHFGSLDSY